MYSPIPFFDEPSTLCGMDDAAAIAASFPSAAAEYYYSNHQVFIVNRSFDFIGPHYVLNAVMILLCVGFLSWCLDSSHGPDVKYIGPPNQESAEEQQKKGGDEPVENISSVDPKADRRRSILRRTRRTRRLTIENIARMIEIEDIKRKEVFGSGPSPLDTSTEALDMGIGGGDVGLNVWSLNQEIRLLREIDLQLEKDGLTVFANPPDEQKPKEQSKHEGSDSGYDTETGKSEKEIGVTTEKVPEGAENDDSVGRRQPYTMDNAKKPSFAAHVLLRLRVPLQWVM